MNRIEKLIGCGLVALLCLAVWPVFRALAEDPSDTPGGVIKWGLGHPNSTADNTHLTALGTSVVKITENSNWVLAQTKDGTLKAWGNNTYGQTNAPSGTWTNSFAGWRHGIAVRPDGSINEWGTPYGNAIADWTNLWPQAMIDGFAADPIIQVAAGDDHSIALSASGKVYPWGGRAEVTNWYVNGSQSFITNATMIDSGWYAIIVLRDDGTVTTHGTVSQSGQYITVPSGLTNATYVGASQWGFYAIDNNGNPWGWGMPDTYGQFTFGPEATNIVSISGGIRHTIMARGDGTVLTYGDNSQGQVTIPSSLTNSLWVVGGRFTSFAIQTDAAGGSGGGGDGNYYVAKTGSDANTGTATSPFLTIQKGLDTALTAGNTVIVSEGDYKEYLVTKASGSSGSPITVTTAGDGDVTIRGFRFNNHTFNVLDGLVISNSQHASWSAAIRVEASAHNNTIQNVRKVHPPHLSRTNWTFDSTSNSIYSASGSDWTAAGFEAGAIIRTGASSIDPYEFANMDRNYTILGITNDALYVTGTLNAETNPSPWSMIYPSPANHTGVRAVDMVVSSGLGATNLTIRDCDFETFGIGASLVGRGPVSITGTRFNTHAWAGLRIGADNVTISNCFFTGTNFIYYSKREQDDVPHDGSPDQYDFRQGYIRSDGVTGTGVTLVQNWFHNIDNPLGQIGTGAYGTNWLFQSNVVVGVMKQWDGLSRIVDLSVLNNTFYRVSFDSQGGSTGHALTHSGTSANPATNHISLRNVFVDIGDHSSTNAEGFYANAFQVNGLYDSNFVSSAESMGWAGKVIFTESNGINGGNPLFANQHDPLGPDGLPFTEDDGLRPLPTSPIAIHGLGALAPVSVATDTPIMHFNLVPATYGWKDASGTNFNTAWEADPPFVRTNFVRPWQTAEAMGEVPLEIFATATNSISGDWFTDSWKGVKRWTWAWGDGATDTRPLQSPTNSHVFLWDGTFNVLLSGYNFASNSASLTRQYRVKPQSAFAGDIFHVKTNGTSGGPGTFASPYQTIAQAHAVVTDGDYIAVHAGQYAEDLDMNRNVATTRISIHGFGAQTDRFRIRNTNWTIWGFDIDNTALGQGGVYVFQAADGAWIINNKFHDYNAGGLAGGIYGAGSAAGSPLDNTLDVRIVGNWFTNVSEPQIQIFGGSNWLVSANLAEYSDGEGDFIRPRGANHIIQDNQVFNMNNGGGGGHPDFIQLDDQAGTGYWWKDLLVQRNWVEGVPTITDASDYAMGQIETGAFADQTKYTNMVLRNNVFVNMRALFSDSNDGMKFFNNTFFQSPRASANVTAGGGARGSSYGTTFRNNIFHQINSIPGPVSADSGWYYTAETGTQNTNTTVIGNYNLVYPAKTTARWTYNGQEANGINGSDPLFVNAGDFFFVLPTNSPAYGTGTDLSAGSGLEGFSTDFWGETRTIWSRGAFEFSTAGETTPPSGIGITIINAGTASVGTIQKAE